MQVQLTLYPVEGLDFMAHKGKAWNNCVPGRQLCAGSTTKQNNTAAETDCQFTAKLAPLLAHGGYQEYIFRVQQLCVFLCYSLLQQLEQHIGTHQKVYYNLGSNMTQALPVATVLQSYKADSLTWA